MNNLRISARTLLISLVALTGFAAIAAVTVWSSWTQSHNADLQRVAAEKFALVQQVSLDFLNARRREKDFLLRLDAAYAKKHGTVSEKVRSDLGMLKAWRRAIRSP